MEKLEGVIHCEFWQLNLVILLLQGINKAGFIIFSQMCFTYFWTKEKMFSDR